MNPFRLFVVVTVVRPNFGVGVHSQVIDFKFRADADGSAERLREAGHAVTKLYAEKEPAT